MATDFKEIEEYIEVKWNNYNPPSIDQENLNHIEKNLKLNRDTINEIIRRLGQTPSDIPAGDKPIYDNSIYDSLLNFKKDIDQLKKNSIDKNTFDSQISNLQEQIDNRLRKDRDDISKFSYTFKKLTLTDGLSVATTSAFNGAVNMKSTLSVTGKTNLNGGVETTTLKATGDANLSKSLNVSGKSNLNGGISVKNGGVVSGTLIVDNLIVNGNIDCVGRGTFGNDLSCGNNFSAGGMATIGGVLWTHNNYLEFGTQREHRLWIQRCIYKLKKWRCTNKNYILMEV